MMKLLNGKILYYFHLFFKGMIRLFNSNQMILLISKRKMLH